MDKKTSAAQRAAAAKYLATKKTLTIRLSPEEAESIEETAKNAGKSVNAYFLDAVKAQSERESGERYYISIPKAAADQAGEKENITGKEWLIKAVKNALEDTND